MSISTALTNAYSGLSAMSRSAETVSNNVSNALTEGYSKQSVAYTSAVLGSQGSGVRIEGIVRSEDSVATQARRRAEAELAKSSVESSAIARLANVLGEPGDPTALASRFLDFETAISNAINTPDSVAIQQELLTCAKNIAEKLNQISTEVDRVRVEADASIFKDVAVVNDALKQVEKLNLEILSLSGRSAASLEDQRQNYIDRINAIIPVRILKTESGLISLFSMGGSALLEGSAREIEFDKTSIITPAMTISAGALSGLAVNGKPIDIGNGVGQFAGGSLASYFAVRDVIAPDYQSQLDAVSVDLIARFQDPAVDPTLGMDDAGLFTDSGGSFSLVNTIGVSGRISVNNIVDPSFGGETWRLRDGLGAVNPCYSGDTAQLIRMANSMDRAAVPPPNSGFGVADGASEFAQKLTSYWAMKSNTAQEEQANVASHFSTLKSSEQRSIGVDSDQEMQSLLLIEQAYAANARVISVIDGLMKKLLEI